MIHVTHCFLFVRCKPQDVSWTSLAAHVAITPLANRLRWQLALKLANTNDYTIINQIASTCVRNSDGFLKTKHVDVFWWCKNTTWLDWVGWGCKRRKS